LSKRDVNELSSTPTSLYPIKRKGKHLLLHILQKSFNL
jgi:hypothetical protein